MCPIPQGRSNRVCFMWMSADCYQQCSRQDKDGIFNKKQAPTIAHMQVLAALSKKEPLIQQPFGLSADSADFIVQMCVIKVSSIPVACFSLCSSDKLTHTQVRSSEITTTRLICTGFRLRWKRCQSSKDSIGSADALVFLLR